MTPARSCLIFTALGLGLLLGGCAEHRSRPAPTASSAPGTTETAPAPATRGREAGEAATRAPGGHRTGKAPAETATLPDNTGIAACDDYLASYVACHRAAAIYQPDQIQDRYEAMRTSLLRDSQDPQIRPQLAARCNALASQLRQALHGKSCEGGPASPSTSPSD